MDRIATGITIALCAVAMNGGYVRDVMAGETGAPAPAAAVSTTSQTPVINGLRSERVLSLILALEALRAVPALSASPKV